MATEVWIDLGNTRLKARTPGRADFVATHDDTGHWLQGLDDWWPSSATSACLASVATAQPIGALRTWLANRGIHWREAATEDGLGGLQLGYTQAAQLGVDRFLALLDAHRRGAAPRVLVSAGSAVTVDTLHPGGVHAGGWIVAPATLQCVALANRLPQLPMAAAHADPRPARDTATALRAGSLAAITGGILLASRLASTGNDVWCPVQLAGGDAEALMPWLVAAGLTVERRDDAVLAGLAIWDAVTR